MPTMAPASAKPTASASPMPVDAPVTSTCLPATEYPMRPPRSVEGVELTVAVTSAAVTLGPDATRLDGTVAIVTGAAVGIGRASALALAAFGADVAICDRDEENLGTCGAAIEALGRRVETGVLDVRDGDAVR